MAKAPVKTEKLEVTDEVEQTIAKEPVEKSKSSAVSVKNLTKVRFVQPSTKINIYGGETKPLENDGWLANQINAGFMEVV